MKYKTAKEFIKAIQDKTFKGKIVIDNDMVGAFERGEKVFAFGGEGPEGALYSLLKALGAKVEFA